MINNCLCDWEKKYWKVLHQRADEKWRHLLYLSPFIRAIFTLWFHHKYLPPFSFYKHCISWIICLLSFWHFNILKMLSCSLYHTHLNSHNYSFFFLCQKQPFIFIKKDENNNNKMKMFVRLFLYQPQFLLKC